MENIPPGGAAVETPLHKQWTELKSKRSRFSGSVHAAMSTGERQEFEWLQSAAENLASIASDPEEKSQARTLNRLLKRLIRGFRTIRPSVGLSQSDAEQVRDLSIALVRRILSENSDLREMGGQSLDFPLDFLINVSYLCSTSEEDDDTLLTPEQQQLRLAFLETGPRLVELAYLSCVPVLAKAAASLPPYRIGEDWHQIQAQVVQLATLRQIGKERALAQTLLIVLNAWHEKGEATQAIYGNVALYVEHLMLGISLESRSQFAPPPPDEDEWVILRPFTDAENTRYRELDAIERVYKVELTNGNWKSQPEELRMTAVESRRFHLWQRQQKDKTAWHIYQDNHTKAWQQLYERERYWQQVRERHRS